MDYLTSQDAVFSAVNAAWLTLGVTPYAPELRFGRNTYSDQPNQSKNWGRLTMLEAVSNQSGFCTRDGQTERRRFLSEGVVILQLFAPNAPAIESRYQDQIATHMRDALRRPAQSLSGSGRVILRNSRILQVSSEYNMLRLNVVSDYEYTETFNT